MMVNDIILRIEKLIKEIYDKTMENKKGNKRSINRNYKRGGSR
jgi:hypothetical protein